MSGLGGKPGWRQAPGWMKLLLILSLSVNVAIAGLVGGNAVRHWQHGVASGKWQNEPGLDRQQTRFLRMVPDARREEAREILRAREDDYKAARETMRAAQQALVEAIRQEPLNAERLVAALPSRTSTDTSRAAPASAAVIASASRRAPGQQAKDFEAARMSESGVNSAFSTSSACLVFDAFRILLLINSSVAYARFGIAATPP